MSVSNIRQDGGTKIINNIRRIIPSVLVSFPDFLILEGFDPRAALGKRIGFIFRAGDTLKADAGDVGALVFRKK